MNKSARLLVVGDVMLDVSVRLLGPMRVGTDQGAKIVQRAGGSAANQAVQLAGLGHEVDFVAAVGAADQKWLDQDLRRSGVAPKLVAIEGLETGRLICVVQNDAERSFFTDRGANDHLPSAHLGEIDIEKYDAVLLSGYSFVAPMTRSSVKALKARAHDVDCPLFIDVGSSGFIADIGPQRFLDDVADVDCLMANVDEAQLLTGFDGVDAQISALRERFKHIVIKRGAEGASVFANGEIVHQGVDVAFEGSRVVDTTGAGDAFAAAYVAAWLVGVPVSEILAAAIMAGSEASTILGARP